MNTRKLLVLVLIVVLISLFFIFDLGQYLNLAALKAQQGALEQWVADDPLPAAGLFFLFYVLVTGYPGHAQQPFSAA